VQLFVGIGGIFGGLEMVRHPLNPPGMKTELIAARSESSGRCSPTGCGCSHSSSASARSSPQWRHVADRPLRPTTD